MRISDWSSDVCSSDLVVEELDLGLVVRHVSLPWSAVADRVEVVVAAGAAAVLVAPPRPDIVRIEAPAAVQLGRPSGGGRVCQYGQISVAAVSIKKKQSTKQESSHSTRDKN